MTEPGAAGSRRRVEAPRPAGSRAVPEPAGTQTPAKLLRTAELSIWNGNDWFSRALNSSPIGQIGRQARVQGNFAVNNRRSAYIREVIESLFK